MAVIFGSPSFVLEKEEKNNVISNFVIYPRIWLDSPEIVNYNIDWNRHKDEIFRNILRSEKNITDDCIKGKDIFSNYYMLKKIQINDEDYFPPYLRMFKNHDIVTGRDVILSLYIHFDERDMNKLYNKKILLDYDSNTLDVGFTDNGRDIYSHEFILEKKYFKDDYFSTNILGKERKTKFEVVVDKNYNYISINNFIVKCKEVISEQKQIVFLDENKNIIGSLIVNPNNNMIFSKRKIRYIKIKRKSSLDSDKKIIENKIKTSNIIDNEKNNIELNENDSLDQFTKNLVMRQLPKIGVNLSANFDIDEVEINDTELIHQGVFLNNSILNSSKYLSIVENQYIENKRFSPEDLKKYIFIFISPIDDNIKQKAAYVIREDIYLFSAMIFSFSIEAVFHEIAHELGLKHTFVDDDKTLSINNENLANLKEHNNKLIRKVEDWEKIYLKNESFNYENKKINKKEFRHIIDEKKEEIKKNNEKINSKKHLINYLQKIEEYHKIYFNRGKTNNIMDYDTYFYGFFDYQFDIIKKLNEEFKHI